MYAQYGAEMVESSVKSISRPVIERLPVNQLDEFACRQLDRVFFTCLFSGGALVLMNDDIVWSLWANEQPRAEHERRARATT